MACNASSAASVDETVSRLPELIALAKEASSERRRELLRKLTHQFFGLAVQSQTETELYSDVVARLLADMELAFRSELAQRFSEQLNTPRVLIQRFAEDDIGVAEPILRSSQVLTDDDLLFIVRRKGQEHLKAVSQRKVVSETVADVIVERSDDETLRVLLKNDGAVLSRQASETAVERARQNPELHEVAVDRKSLPMDLLNELYFVVEAELRRRIIARNASLDPLVLETALSAGLARLAAEDGVLPVDYLEGQALVRRNRSGASLSAPELARVLRSGHQTAFRIALADAAEVDFYTVSRIIARREVDGLAILCKAGNLEGPLFLTIALSLLGGSAAADQKARSYSFHYAELTREAAQRTLRFWRLRRSVT